MAKTPILTLSLAPGPTEKSGPNGSCCVALQHHLKRWAPPLLHLLCCLVTVLTITGSLEGNVKCFGNAGVSIQRPLRVNYLSPVPRVINPIPSHIVAEAAPAGTIQVQQQTSDAITALPISSWLIAVVNPRITPPSPPTPTPPPPTPTPPQQHCRSCRVISRCALHRRRHHWVRVQAPNVRGEHKRVDRRHGLAQPQAGPSTQ